MIGINKGNRVNRMDELIIQALCGKLRMDTVSYTHLQHGKVTRNVATIEVQHLDPDTLPDTEVLETTYELLSDEDFSPVSYTHLTGTANRPADLSAKL